MHNSHSYGSPGLTWNIHRQQTPPVEIKPCSSRPSDIKNDNAGSSTFELPI